MDRIFFDTNCIIDLLGERQPFYDATARITTLADKGKIEMIVSALSYATVFYILQKFEHKEIVKEKISKLKIIVETSDLTDKVVEQGLYSEFSDFEDALQYFCALQKDCSMIITRNGKDFKESALPVLTPDEYLSRWKNMK